MSMFKNEKVIFLAMNCKNGVYLEMKNLECTRNFCIFMKSFRVWTKNLNCFGGITCGMGIG